MENGTPKLSNYTTIVVALDAFGYQYVQEVIHDDLKIRGNFKLFNEKGSELSEEEFFSLDSEDIIYVARGGK